MRKEYKLMPLFLLFLILIKTATVYGNNPAPLKTRDYKTLSPDGKIALTVFVGEDIRYQVEDLLGICVFGDLQRYQ